jgi:hypothetical protein
MRSTASRAEKLPPVAGTQPRAWNSWPAPIKAWLKTAVDGFEFDMGRAL